MVKRFDGVQVLGYWRKIAISRFILKIRQSAVPMLLEYRNFDTESGILSEKGKSRYGPEC